jgi:hypothetical protein
MKTKGNINIINNLSKKLDNALILNRIKSHYKFKSDAQMARFLGLTTSAYANWHARQSIKLELLITKCADLNPNWIIYGTGNPLKNYINLDETSLSKNAEEEAGIYKLNFKEDEIERLNQIIIAQDKTIAAQARTIELMEQLIEKNR